MSTPQDIIVAAHGRSTKNRPDQIATNATELFARVMDALNGIYLFAAEVNPDYFGKSSSVAFASGGWPKPSDANSVWRIETNDGVEVVVVPRTDRAAEIGRPAVYFLGRKYYSAGNPLDPTSGNLTMLFSQRPVTPASWTTAFDSSWDTGFDGFLIEEVALYLALKDGRAEEVAELRESRDRWARRFAGALQNATPNLVYRYGNVRNINVPQLIQSYLVGGAS